MNVFSLQGKKAVVTGAGQGLGRGMAEGMLEAGAETLFLDVSPKVEEVAAEYAAKGMPAKALVFDLGDQKAVAERFDDILAPLGGAVDILVNNAGIQRRSPFLDFPLEYWEDVMNVNLTSVFHLSRLAANVMVKNGGGKIINIASMNSFFGGVNVPAYAACKGGVALLTKAMSNELAGKNVNVNAIAPGYMDTEMNQMIRNPEVAKTVMDRVPKGRWGTPGDMKWVAVFLASAAADYVTGAVIPVDGGYLAR